MRVGICGFSASGKSTIFSALSPGGSSRRGGITYGNIKVPDGRVDRLAEIFQPRKRTYAEVTFMDVPGDPGRRGAAFSSTVLQAIRNADVLVHVVRAFESPYHGTSPDPEGDVSRFGEELVLMDLEVLERRGRRFAKENRKGAEVQVNAWCVAHLEGGEPLRALGLTAAQVQTLQGIQLPSLKPLVTVYNTGEDDWADSPWRALDDPASIALCGSLEAEIAEMDEEDQAEFLEDLGLDEPARLGFIRKVYEMLDLISFLTAGPDECRAWTIKKGTVARKAAGTIHSDLERGFIRAEVYRLADLLEHGTEAALKSAGKMRMEGKGYVVKDGDVMNVRFNV